MQRELERGDDTEVAPTASQRPEQVGVVVDGCSDDVTLGRDHFGGEQVVDREPEFTP